MRNLSSFQIPSCAGVPPLVMHHVKGGSGEIKVTVFQTLAHTGPGGCPKSDLLASNSVKCMRICLREGKQKNRELPSLLRTSPVKHFFLKVSFSADNFLF